MANIQDLIRQNPEGYGTCMFKRGKDTIWSNGRMLVVNDPNLVNHMGDYVIDELLKEDTPYQLRVIKQHVQIAGVDIGFPLYQATTFLKPDESLLSPAFVTDSVTLHDQRRVVGVYFHERVGFGRIPGTFFDEQQFEYLAGLSTDIYQAGEGQFLHFMDEGKHRGLITTLCYTREDLDKLVLPDWHKPLIKTA